MGKRFSLEYFYILGISQVKWFAVQRNFTTFQSKYLMKGCETSSSFEVINKI